MSVLCLNTQNSFKNGIWDTKTYTKEFQLKKNMCKIINLKHDFRAPNQK